jgi:hypothetical protein
MAQDGYASKGTLQLLVGAGIAAATPGAAAVIDGIKNKLQVAAADVMTDAQTARLHRAQTEPGSGES